MRYLGKGSVSSLLGALLNVIWCVMFLAMGGVLLAMLILGVLAPDTVPPNAGGSLTLDARFLSLGFPQTELKNPQTVQLGLLAFTLVTLAVAQAIVHQLRKLFKALRLGMPFTTENVKRIRAIGAIIIGGSLLQSLAAFFVGRLMMDNIMARGVEMSARISLPGNGIFIGLVILVLAEVIRHGAALQEEQNLTI